MRKPKKNRPYILVRPARGSIEAVEFTRYNDDSATLVVCEDKRMLGFEDEPGIWKQLWNDLKSRGFIVLQEARDLGIVPENWEPGCE